MEGHSRRANLFIVGAMKAGTTSFNALLSQHPDVYFSPIKEPNFFADPIPAGIYQPSPFFSLDTYFHEEFPRPLHIAQVRDSKQYETLFSLAGSQRYLAEGSTAYLHDPSSAEKIYSYNPEAKIIILIRDGLKRAFSHYKMDVGLGRTTATFEQELRKNWDAYKNGTLSNWSYLGMSLYAENIKRYQYYFGNKVLLITFEELLNRQAETLKSVFGFLSIENKPLVLEHANESSNIRFRKALYWLHQSGLKPLLSKLLPVKIRHIAFKLISNKAPLVLDIDPDFKEALLEQFKEDLKKII